MYHITPVKDTEKAIHIWHMPIKTDPCVQGLHCKHLKNVLFSKYAHLGYVSYDKPKSGDDDGCKKWVVMTKRWDNILQKESTKR